MFQVNKEADVTILDMDVVRMNPGRTGLVLRCVKEHPGLHPFVFCDCNGVVQKVELWGGTELERQAFIQRLKSVIDK